MYILPQQHLDVWSQHWNRLHRGPLQNYDVDGNGDWRYASQYDYSQSSVESTINTIWNSTYNAIANLNIMIRNIDKADSTRFSENNYYVYRGEAYGLAPISTST